MFCRICGKEVSEQAFACPNCGCLVNGGQEKKKDKLVCKGEKNNKLLKTFLIISFSLVALSLLLSLASAFFAVLKVRNGSYNFSASIHTAKVAIPAFVMGILALGSGITAFVMGLQQKDEALKMFSIISFIFSVMIFVTSFLAFGQCHY